MNRTDDSPEQGEASQKLDTSLLAPRASLSATSPAFHSDDVEHVANYQSLSVLALISLLLGVLSALSIVSKVFLLLPLGGVATSLLALRRINLSEGRLAGRWAAVVGLALCVACGATAITRNTVARYLRTRQAETFARSWLAQVASNELESAFKATYEGARPLPPQEPGMPAPEKSPYDMFLSDSLIQRISAAGADAKIQYVKTLEFTPQTRQDMLFRQQFSIAPTTSSEESGAADPITAYLTLQRSRFRGDQRPRWLITRYEPQDNPRK